MNRRFLYHAEAFGASGTLTLPHQEVLDVQASVSLPLTGGHAKSRVENFSHRNLISFEAAESHVVGSYSEKDKAHGTLSTSMIEGLNIMDVVTCDRIIARVTSKHPDDGSEASIIPLGSRFENLRIAGQKIEPDLAIDTFCECDTWGKLEKAHSGDEKFRAAFRKLSMLKRDDNALPASKSMVGCSLMRNLDALPGGLKVNGPGILVPHFGTVYLAEFFVTPGARRLLMIRVELGCSVEGGFSGGGAGGNGSGYP
jgi:hypothetical protein